MTFWWAFVVAVNAVAVVLNARLLSDGHVHHLFLVALNFVVGVWSCREWFASKQRSSAKDAQS